MKKRTPALTDALGGPLGVSLAGLSMLLLLSDPAAAVQFRWDTTSGVLETYTVTVERRIAGEPLASRQTGKLTRVILECPQPGHSNFAQMLELTQAEPVVPEDTAARWGDQLRGRIRKAPPRTQFATGTMSPTQAALLIPGGSPVEKDILRALLDWGPWPAAAVGEGAAWQSDCVGSVLVGRRTIRVAQLDTRPGGEARATLHLTAELAPADDPAAVPRIVRAEADVTWAVSPGRPLRVTAQAVYVNPSEEIRLAVRIVALSRLVLTTGEHNQTQEQISRLATAVNAYQAERPDEARAQLEQFRRAWPRSRWRPVADFLLDQIRADERSEARLLTAATAPASRPGHDLRTRLAGLLGDWQPATRSPGTPGEPIRVALERIARAERDGIIELTRSADPADRTLACVALAFGRAPADAVVLSRMVEDPDAMVRAVAYYALSLRGPLLVAPELFEAGFADPDPLVRTYACEAIASCVRPTADGATALADRLAELLADDSPRVREAAARAIAALGDRRHVSLLRRAAAEPANRAGRAAMEAAADRLESRLRTPAPP